ncbi:MAG: DUF2279 domain-containing protein [Bacteroidetes bacterium]|nr:DUF2279 domain-containing protein [Bacteroidota bacterium]
MYFKKLISLLILITTFNVSFAQDTLNVKRLKTVVATESIVYSVSMIGLYQLWYKNEPTSPFHLFNDNQQWLYMDKIGHAMTSYYVGKVGYEALSWSGVTKKKAIWYGGTLGLAFLTSVEVFDGFSNGWGFSTGDMAANIFGSGLFIGQQLGWKEQRVLLKYSFYPTDYAAKRPNLLGEKFLQQTLKDYNGQTYWLSVNVASFLNEESKFPKWLNIAVGYGADGMLGGRDNKFISNNEYFDYSDIKRQKQFYLSLDIDLTRIKTKNQFLSAVFNTFGFIKFPFPTLVYEESEDIKLIPIQ